MKVDPLPPEEFAKRAAPGGRLPLKGAKNTVAGDKAYTPISDASPAAITAAAAERQRARASSPISWPSASARASEWPMYKPELPEDVKLPDGHSINTAHADYKALEALATRHRWSQAAFSETLGLEAKRDHGQACRCGSCARRRCNTCRPG